MQAMTKPPAPEELSRVIVSIQKEAKRQGLTAYAIADLITKDRGTKMHIRTVQRCIDGDVSPSLATLEAVSKALGLVIEVRKS